MSIAHPNLQPNCQWLTCIVGNVVASVWQGIRMCGIKTMISLVAPYQSWFFLFFNLPQCYASEMLHSSILDPLSTLACIVKPARQQHSSPPSVSTLDTSSNNTAGHSEAFCNQKAALSVSYMCKPLANATLFHGCVDSVDWNRSMSVQSALHGTNGM